MRGNPFTRRGGVGQWWAAAMPTVGPTRIPSEETPVDRRAFHRSVLLTTITAPLVTAGPAHARPARGVPRRSVVECGLPHAEQAHELVRVPGLPPVLVSQMSNSHLVKVRLDPAGEQVLVVRAHPLGEVHSTLHGLAVSQRHPGPAWATHEGDNRLLLVDPNGADGDAPPRVLRTIDVPGGGQGPHYVGEYGDQLWVSLKTSNHVLSIDHADPSRFRLYEARPNPIFVARHPVSGSSTPARTTRAGSCASTPGPATPPNWTSPTGRWGW